MKLSPACTPKIPWFTLRAPCARCRGLHAPWWRTTAPPSCGEEVTGGYPKAVRRAMTGSVGRR
jgi:hypothetical protein